MAAIVIFHVLEYGVQGQRREDLLIPYCCSWSWRQFSGCEWEWGVVGGGGQQGDHMEKGRAIPGDEGDNFANRLDQMSHAYLATPAPGPASPSCAVKVFCSSAAVRTM